MPKFKDITGKRFGRFVAVKYVGKNKNNASRWLCKCDCGNEIITLLNYLSSNETKSCGCAKIERCKATAIDIKGSKFGRLLVVERSGSKNNQAMWKCLCDCGNIKYASCISLRSGSTKSCGCLHKELSRERIIAIAKLQVGINSPVFQDLTNKKFGKLRVINRCLDKKIFGTFWYCVCDCGKETIVDGGNLKSGNTSSCGCKRLDWFHIHCGELSPTWNGGSSFLPYCAEFNNVFKEYIRNKFNRKCFICSKSEEENGRKLDVHHITYNKSDSCNYDGPFVPVCRSHNLMFNKNKWYWFNLLINYWLDNPNIHLNNLMVVSL
jgi:hypothetical protein